MPEHDERLTLVARLEERCTQGFKKKNRDWTSLEVHSSASRDAESYKAK